MSEKTSNFRASTLSRHAESRDHKKAITDEIQSKNLAHSMADRLLSKGEKAATVVLKTKTVF